MTGATLAFPARKVSRGGKVAGAIIIGAWALAVLGADALLAYNAARASASSGYRPTPATIVSAGVDSRRSAAGRGARLHAAKVEYRYTVAGVEHVGTRIRYADYSSSSARRAWSSANQYKPGQVITAFVNPADATDAVLEPGLTGRARFAFVLLLPFNLVLVGMVMYASLAARGRIAGPPLVIEGATTRVRLNVLPATLVGVMFALGGSVVALFAGGWAMGSDASAPALAWISAGVLAAGVAGWAWMHRRITAGAYDLVIDRVRGVVALPPARIGRGSAAETRFGDILRIETGRSETTSVSNRPVTDVRLVIGRGGEEQRVRLRSWARSATARAFARWLRERVPTRR